MLVLTRCLNESVVIGDDIEVTVVEIRPDKVRLGIQAQKSIPVYRKEIYEAIQKQNIEAAQAAAADLQRLEDELKDNKPSSKRSDKATSQNESEAQESDSD